MSQDITENDLEQYRDKVEAIIAALIETSNKGLADVECGKMRAMLANSVAQSFTINVVASQLLCVKEENWVDFITDVFDDTKHMMISQLPKISEDIDNINKNH